jgi:hypothetical protein
MDDRRDRDPRRARDRAARVRDAAVAAGDAGASFEDVRIVAIAALTLALSASAAATAAAPKRTSVTGTIEALERRAITVDGARTVTCRLTAASPKPRLRGFAVGARARITCVRGVLSAIVRPSAVSGGVKPSGNAMTTKPEPAPAPKPAESVAGTSTITALGGGEIVFGGAIACRLAAASPSVGAYRVGSRVSYTCTAGALTRIGPAEGT